MSGRSDADMAKAFRGLESPVCDVHDMMLLVDIAAEGTVRSYGGEIAKLLAERAGFDTEGYRILVMTEDQATGLNFALHQIGDLTRKLRREYYAGYGEPV